MVPSISIENLDHEAKVEKNKDGKRSKDLPEENRVLHFCPFIDLMTVFISKSYEEDTDDAQYKYRPQRRLKPKKSLSSKTLLT
jgi:hypothetical protein